MYIRNQLKEGRFLVLTHFLLVFCLDITDNEVKKQTPGGSMKTYSKDQILKMKNGSTVKIHSFFFSESLGYCLFEVWNLENGNFQLYSENDIKEA
jgi:hypothetical protein